MDFGSFSADQTLERTHGALLRAEKLQLLVFLRFTGFAGAG
jgi:hypothetical protein